ncbi:MAG: hypothetical protein U9R51_02300 [Actinomycetota bacterium]|nr:hypothetical protein [Actinomycetota bacterium]
MIYVTDKLIESIHQDRHREAEIARMNAVPKAARTSRRRLFAVPPFIADAMGRTPTMTSPRRV